MTPRTLFNIILKILGIFFIKDILAVVPQLFSVGIYLTRSDTMVEAIWMLVITLLTLLVYGLVVYYLVFKSNLIIDKLRLDKGFDEETIALNVHRSTVLSIAIIIVGGLLIADEVPNLCSALFSYLQEKRMTHGMTSPTISYSIVPAIKIIIGLVLIREQRKIVNLIERKRKK